MPDARRPVLVLSDRKLDLEQHLVLVDGAEPVELTPLEATLLGYLADRADEAVDRDVLLREVWGYAPNVQSRAIDKTVHRLRTKLEVDPAEPRHLQGVRGLGYRLTGFSQQALEAPRTNLQAPLTPGFGQEAPLGRVRERISAPGSVVALVGPPGSGKTRLCAELAQILIAQGWSCWWVNLAESADLEAAAEVLCEAVGGRWSPSLPPLEAAIRALGRGGAALLVLDGASPEIARPLVARLRTCARCLLVQRAPLPEIGAAQVRVPPLGPEEGAALLLDRALRAGAEVQPGPELEQIAEALGGHPQSLELLAPRLALMAPAGLLAQVRAALRRRPEARWSQALTLAVAHQWGALSAAEAEVLAACAAFPCPFSAADAVALLPERDPDGALDALQAAVQLGLLVRADEHVPLYHLPEPLRRRALERLRELGLEEEVSVRIARRLTEEAEALERDVREGRAARGFAGLERLRGALLGVVERAQETDPLLAARAALPLALVQVRRHPPRYAATLARLRERPEARALSARLGVALANALRRAGQLAAARAEAQRVLDEPGVPPVARAEALLLLGGTAGVAGADRHHAEQEIHEALVALEGLSEHRVATRVRTMLGSWLIFEGRPEEGLLLFRDAMAFYRRSGDIEGLGQAMNFALTALFHLRRPEEAQPLADEVIGVCRKAHDGVQEAWAFSNLNGLYWEAGRLDEMQALALATRQLAREMGDRYMEVMPNESLAFVAVERGLWEVARYHFDALRRGCLEIGAEAVSTSGVSGLGLVDHLEGKLDGACARYDEAIAWSPGRGHRLYLRWVLALRHLLAAERQEPDAYTRTLDALQSYLGTDHNPDLPIYRAMLDAAAVLRRSTTPADLALAIRTARAAMGPVPGHEGRIFLLILERALARRG